MSHPRSSTGPSRLSPWIHSLIALGCVATPMLFGVFFKPGAWYSTIEKPSWTPPGFVFGIVWPILYLLMGVALYRVLRSHHPSRKSALVLFAAQLVLNGLWSWIFFGQHRIGWALVEIIALLLLIVACLLVFWRVDRVAFACIVPYGLWASFATALNATIWSMN